MSRLGAESESAHQVARLEKLIPPEKLAAILRRMADRAEELNRSREGAIVKLAIHFNRGKLLEGQVGRGRADRVRSILVSSPGRGRRGAPT